MTQTKFFEDFASEKAAIGVNDFVIDHNKKTNFRKSWNLEVNQNQILTCPP